MWPQRQGKKIIFFWLVALLGIIAVLLLALGWISRHSLVPLSSAFTGQTHQPVEEEQAAETPCRSPIVITSDPDYPPISWQDRSNPQRIIGVAIELVELAFGELGIPVESRYLGPWKRTLQDAATGDVDILTGLYITEEREEFFDFVSPPFLPDPTAIFVMKGAAFPFERWEDLQGLPGGKRLGDSYGDEFDAFAKNNLALQEVTSFEQLYKMTEADRIRYIVYGLYPGLSQAEELGVRANLEYLPNFVVSEDIYMAFSKQSSCTFYREFLAAKLQEYVDAQLPEALVEKYVLIWNEQAHLSPTP